MSKITDLQNKYPNLNIEYLSSLDHTKTKKFLPWLCKQKLPKEDDKIKFTLSRFEKNISKLEVKDINQYKSWKDLEKVVAPLISIAEQKANGSEVVFKDDNCEIIWLKDHVAAKYYSAGTKWCISNKSGWDTSCKNGNLYVLNINFHMFNTKVKRKIAVVINYMDCTTELYDEKDHAYELSEDFPNEIVSRYTYEAPDNNIFVLPSDIKEPKKQLLSMLKKCDEHAQYNALPVELYDQVPKLSQKSLSVKDKSEIVTELARWGDHNEIIRFLKIYTAEQVSVCQLIKEYVYHPSLKKEQHVLSYCKEFLNSSEYKKFAVKNKQFISDVNKKVELLKEEHELMQKQENEKEKEKQKKKKQLEIEAKTKEVLEFLSKNKNVLEKVNKALSKNTKHKATKSK
jgi:hypothetical protein